ncbi:hypothetical protein [Novosphingobium rosa]|nr:hypothetical protein [Novosphingobium rosa]
MELFPAWSDEAFPLYAIYPSRRHRPAKVQVVLDFIARRIAEELRQ